MTEQNGKHIGIIAYKDGSLKVVSTFALNTALKTLENKMNLNKVMLIGNLTRDPQLRYTPNGTAVAEFGMALNRQFGQGNDRKEEVTYVDITAWARTAEICNEYLSKGRPVFVEGRLKLDTWEDKNGGGNRSKLSVVAETVQFLGNADKKTQHANRSDETLSYDFNSSDVPF